MTSPGPVCWWKGAEEDQSKLEKENKRWAAATLSAQPSQAQADPFSPEPAFSQAAGQAGLRAVALASLQGVDQKAGEAWCILAIALGPSFLSHLKTKIG